MTTYPNTFVLLIEPAKEIDGRLEDLTVTQQINELFGPFEDDDQALTWIDRFQERHSAPSGFFKFHILEAGFPPDLPATPDGLPPRKPPD